MSRWTACLRRVLALVACGFVAAHAATPSVRVAVQGTQPVLVGQQVAVDVTVVAPNFFTSAPPFPSLEVPGAIVDMPDERATLGVETVAGETYATVQKRYLFTAQQAGDFNLPPVRIAFTYGGDGGKPQQASLSLPATRITARLPAGAAANPGAALPVARLHIAQRFDRSTDALHAGDALVRTVEVSAEQTQAMMIPPPTFVAPNDVRVFVADPQLSDEGRRNERAGFQGGRRVDRATYVFERAGRYTLPAIELRWIDPATQRPATAQAPAVTVQVGAGPSRGDAIAPEGAAQRAVHWARWVWTVACAVLGGAALFWIVRQGVPRWRAWRNARRERLAQSDGAMFRQVLAACARDDAASAHAALLAWCARHAQAAPRDWAAGLGDDALLREMEALERHLYRTAAALDTGWQGAGLATALQGAHKLWQQQRTTRHGRRVAHALGPLNPVRQKA